MADFLSRTVSYTKIDRVVRGYYDMTDLCGHFSLKQTDLSCIVADSEGWSLVFGWGVPIAILGGE